MWLDLDQPSRSGRLVVGAGGTSGDGRTCEKQCFVIHSRISELRITVVSHEGHYATRRAGSIRFNPTG